MTDPTTTGTVVDVAEEKEPLWKRLRNFPTFWILLVLLLIFTSFSLLSPQRFLTYDNVMNITQNVSIWAVIAVGMTYVIITSGIDLSVGSVLVVSSVLAAKSMEAMGGEGWAAAGVGALVAIVSGAFWGALNGWLVARAKVPPFIVTLGTLSVALGAAQILTNGLDIRSVPTVLQDSIGYGRILGIPVLSIIAAVVVVIGGLALHKTRFGLYTYAIGSNELSARRVGVRVDAQIIKVYGVAGTMAGLAGIMSLAQFGTTTIAGQSMTNLNVITAVVLGGTSVFGGIGTMLGSMIGLFIPAVLMSGFVITGVSPYWQTAAVGAILIVAVYIDQQRREAQMRGGKPKTRAK